MLRRLNQWAREVARDLVALWIAARDPRVPRYAKLMAGGITAYALSPIDLIPDFIPVLGYLDDLVIVPAGVLLTVRMIPAPLMADCRAEAARRESRPGSRVGAVLIVAPWILAVGIAAKMLT